MIEPVDKTEVERFGAIASEWWDPNGKFAPLHRINPARLAYIREQLEGHFGLERSLIRPFRGLSVLDVGCGGGLIAEPMARLGARVAGLDPSEDNIAVAREHAEKQALAIDYTVGTTQDLVERGAQFDALTALEVVEHVPDVSAFLKSCAELLKPGGLLIVSTLNRTAAAYALGIVAAEYLLGWLPQGTHTWSRFVTPAEMRDFIHEAELEPNDQTGLSFNPVRGEWALSSDCSVNYFVAATRTAQ